MVSVFAPNLRKLLPKHFEKSCNRRRRFTVRTGGDKIKRRRVWLDWDKRDAGGGPSPIFTPISTGQLADGDRVTTFKTYHGTHEGPFLGIAPTHRKIQFESVDVMRVQNGKITDHWGVGNLLSLIQQIGGWTPPAEAAISR